jgi:predicted nuclease of predicted toxin-antitoxin system
VTPQSPAIVWLRIGNSRKKALLDWFELHLSTIEEALAEGDRLIEVV